MNKPLFLSCAIAATCFAAAQAFAPMTMSVAPAASTATAEIPAAAYVKAEEQRRFAEAVAQYRAGRWSAAYGRFAALADRGHVRAARIALSMHRDGPTLYGAAWDAAPSQLLAWERAALPPSDANVAVDRHSPAISSGLSAPAAIRHIPLVAWEHAA